MRRGFTLIELVVVMAIIAVLAALMTGAIVGARKQAINTQRIGNAKTLETLLESYRGSNKGYPLRCNTADAAYSQCDLDWTEVTATVSVNGKRGLQEALTVSGIQKSPIVGLNDYIRYYTTPGNAGKGTAPSFVLTACSGDSTGYDDSGKGSTYLIPGTPDKIGTVSGCTGGTVIYSTAR